ncbi:YD repeat-containing protein [Rhodanobacter sp. K2T2]|uniref:RHS repeat protein n=1 Tax=Rhodanobacter sp. K2T2 TaxID=2723085 RepID=UPI0015C8A78E|nr:RHS repeat protein [Rhodanobacter sp. K2T2]NYE30634.1 YD repeat-containing protein [Rhodanobacter sp. K2T2]
MKYELYYHNRGINPWSDDSYYSLDTACGYDPNYNGGPCPGVKFYRADGSTILFNGTAGKGPFTESGAGNLATLTYNSASATYTLQDEDATTKVFSSTGALISTKDASGIGWTFSSAQANGILTLTITHTNGQSMTIAQGPGATTVVNGKSVFTSPVVVTDPAGNAYTLHQTQANYDSIAFPGSPATTINFKYNATSFYGGLSEVDYNGTPYAYTSYRTDTSAFNGWATSTYLADGSQNISINYATDSAGNVQATVTNPLGHQAVQTYDGTYGTGGSYNGQLSSVSNNAVADCGATVNSRQYDNNGNLSQTVDNNGNVHTYTYAANGQLQTETEAYGTSQARTTDYVWDPNAQLNRLTSATVEGWSKTAYTYNAQNRVASVSVTNLSANGTANQTLTTQYNYTLYANGMVQTMSVTRPSPNNSDTDVTTYDTLGNVSSFADGLGHTTTYSNYNGLGEPQHVVGPNGDATDFVYDARGRISTKTTHPNGTAATWTYTYDGFGLLYTLTTPDNEVTTWNRNAEMMVQTITHNDKDGTSTETFGYDPNGDVTSHIVTRGSDVGLKESATYDALGRLYQKTGNNGQTLTYAYDGNGNVLSTTNAVGHVINYQYDHLDRLTQTVESGGASPSIPTAAPTLSAPANSSNGSYTVSWTAVSGATSYILQEQANGGAWTTIQNSSATSVALSGKSPATFGYRAQACTSSGCGPWSNVGSVIVTQVTGSIDGVSIDGSGNATVTGWACSTGIAQSISVDLYLGGPAGTGTDIGRYTANQTSEPAVASACDVSSGSYRYSIPLSVATRSQYAGQAIYLYGISPIGAANLALANAGSFQVPVNEPAGAPTLNVPTSANVSYYTVSWSAVSGATSYTLQEQVNGGAWATVQNSAATSWAATGKSNNTYGYRVQACNSSGCGAWSVTASVTVAIPPIPASAPALSVPSASYTGGYTISWGGVSAATSYTLQEQVNGGGWSTVQASASASWSTASRGAGSYGYRVQACNVSGCGPWSGTGTVTVTAPTAAPALSAPATNATGSYTVSWGGVTGASAYLLQQQVNGGGWTTLQNSAAASLAVSGETNGSYGYRVQACDAVGCGPFSGTATTVVTIPVPLSINGQSYTESYAISKASGSASIGFEIVSGTTWDVWGSKPNATHAVLISGAVPATAVTVQYVWTLIGPPAGDSASTGTLVNPAASPVAITSNPSSNYVTSLYTASSNGNGEQYQLTVTFFNAAGANVSSSTCTLTAKVVGTN